MKEYKTGAVRDTGGKGRMDLLPMCALIRVSKHMEDAITPDPETGKSHYPERNWEVGLPMHTMIDSAFRHLAKYVDGQDDEDHLCAAATNLLMAMWTEEKRPNMQDIPSRRRPVAPSLDSECECDRKPTLGDRSQGRGKEEAQAICPSYMTSKSKCLATKGIQYCNCCGDVNKCDWYPEVPKHAK